MSTLSPRRLLAAAGFLLATAGPATAQNLMAPVPSRTSAPGLYVQVLDGAIHLTNAGGTTSFAAGQFGFVASLSQPPVILPANPGIQFTPPPNFTATSTANAGSTKAGAVDCTVR